MTESSKEAVALELLQIIAAVEGKNLTPTTSDDDTAPGTQWVFKTYVKCLDLVENPQNYTKKKPAAAKPKKPAAVKQTTTQSPVTK